MIRVADYIVRFLEGKGVTDVFMISGGGAMHLNDAVGRSEKISYWCNHHEQASAIAAEGYARVKNKTAVVVVTTGPGGTNTLTGVIGQWFDSVPTLYISGQVKFETSVYACPDLGLRQLGDQELDIVRLVKPITKYAAFVDNPRNIRAELERAWFVANDGRPGPVWLDIPINVQGALIDPDNLPSAENLSSELKFDSMNMDRQIEKIVELLYQSERPVLVPGRGVKIAGAEKLVLDLARKLSLPILSTFNAADVLPTDNEFHIGRIGTVGSRAGNFALQNSDLYISIGSRNNIRQISYSWKNYARAAKVVAVDIDFAELNKPTLTIDVPVHADACSFLTKFLSRLDKEESLPDYSGWLHWCSERKAQLPAVSLENEKRKEGVDLYCFFKKFTALLPTESILVAGNGSACVGLFQAGEVKKGQRVFWNSGCASMGYDLPAAIGASVASKFDQCAVYCFAGDGSLQMNIQELATVVHYGLPIKIIYLNNGGYVSIKQTQDSFFPGNRVACDAKTGVGLPDMSRLAAAYGLDYYSVSHNADIEENSLPVIESVRPCVYEIFLPHDYFYAPKLSSLKKPDGTIVSKPLEDMFPFLERDEFRKHMIIASLEE